MDPDPLTLDTLRTLARARGLDLSDAELAGLLPLVEAGRARRDGAGGAYAHSTLALHALVEKRPDPDPAAARPSS